MNYLQMDWRCIQGARGGIPHGYILANGTIVIWENGQQTHNFATKEQALVKVPNLVIINETEPSKS